MSTGLAKTKEFLLSTATVMIGPQAKVFELDPETHSIGLVKNIQVSGDMQFTELTQGLQAQVVSSINTRLETKISGEVYEYTAKNLAYGAGIDGTGISTITESYALSAPLTGASTTMALVSATDIVPGSWLVIQDLNRPDRVHVTKAKTITTNTVTLETGMGIPAGQTFAVASTVVYRVNSIDVGAIPVQPTFGAKLVGILPESGEPITLIFPKVKITKGISLAFQGENFSNMPFEFTPNQLVGTDPFYADFGIKTWKILRR